MSSTKMMSNLPVPEQIISCPPAPSTRRTESRIVRPIPINIEEVDSVNELLTEATTPKETRPLEEEVMENLEIVFFDRGSNRLYKLFVDGTWEYLKLTTIH